MYRKPTISFDRGTLILHPPPQGKTWIDYATWDDRVEKFRVRAIDYRPLVELLKAEKIDFIDKAKEFAPLELIPSFEMLPYPHQEAALKAWKQNNRNGVVILLCLEVVDLAGNQRGQLTIDMNIKVLI